MSRTLWVGLMLIGLAACGGGSKKPATAKSASHVAAKPAARATNRKATQSKTRRKATAADTSASRNPLTNH